MSNTSQPLRIAIAGTTSRTVICAEALRRDERFQISWILTPQPKPIGRKKTITKNPLHSWSEEHAIPATLLEHKIDAVVKEKVVNNPEIDFLLVVDFGYLIPKWLLELPQQAPLNIHPSALPRWRGSSPGQFVLLYGETESAITLMVMDETLDSGPIIAQLPFTVDQNWTQKEYYLYSFELIQEKLADLIAEFAAGKLTAIPQPADSPTPIARRLTRIDGFITWDLVSHALRGTLPTHYSLEGALSDARSAHPTLAHLIAAACRAFSPWPGLSTRVKTAKGNLSLKIVSCHVESNKLVLDQVQLEGKTPTSWNLFKSQIIE